MSKAKGLKGMDPWAPILNPKVPYSGAIPAGLVTGKVICISGVVPQKAHKFRVRLCSCLPINGRKPDLILHMGMRFYENVVARNARIKKNWGKEEHEGGMPFKAGQSFEMMILVTDQDFKIAVNGQHFASFAHRVPYSQATVLNIERNVELKKIEYRMEQSVGSPSAPILPPSPLYPVVAPLHMIPAGGAMAASVFQPIFNPVLPLTYNLAGGISGLLIYINGKPTAKPKQFRVDLLSRSDNSSESDISFHFNPRFENNLVVRNSRIGGNWGPEEREIPAFPFTSDTIFDMIIKVDPTHFMVAVNGQHFIGFQHRVLPLVRTNTLRIEGDVEINSVRFQ